METSSDELCCRVLTDSVTGTGGLCGNRLVAESCVLHIGWSKRQFGFSLKPSGMCYSIILCTAHIV